MNRREFLGLSARALAAGALTASLPAWAAAAANGPRRKPNIILIVADDLGYAEIGVQGCKDIPTPHIDSLAANGVRFTSGYVTCPVCSPTRAGLLTGRYQQRFGHELNPGPAGSAPEFGLALSEKTLPERLRALGYATGMFGKWHLGNRPEYVPTARGFDEFYGFLGGAHSYTDPGNAPPNQILRGTKPVDKIEYTTRDFAREAAAFIERHKDEPFFCYLPFNSVHTPLQALKADEERFQHITDRKRRTFAAMLASMDDGVGTVLGKLREHKLEEDTLVIFLSDNGGPTPGNTAKNDPLRGTKGQVLEGGIRVPFLMQWKGRLPAGDQFDRPIHSLDICPTVLAAAGGAKAVGSELEGVDLTPHLTGKRPDPPHKALFWRYGAQRAVRMNDWKLVQTRDGGEALYNLAEDVGETKDLAAANPAKVAELRKAYEDWDKKNIAPKWPQEKPPARQQRRANRRQTAKQKAR